MNEKTKYKGVFFDSERGTYLIQTTFTSKDGVHIKKCKRGFRTIEDANQWKEEVSSEIKCKNYQEICSSKSTMSLLIEEYIKFKSTNLKPATLFQTKRMLNKYFLPYFDFEVKHISVSDIANFYQGIASMEMQNNSKNVILQKVLGFVEYLDLMDYISADLSRKFKRILQKFDLSMITNRSSFLELDEYRKFINSFQNEEDMMYKLVFNILYFTGARIGEVLALKFSDLDVKRNVLHFDKQIQYLSDKSIIKNHISYNNYYVLPYTKTNTVKDVKIPDWLKEDVGSYLAFEKKNKEDYIFFKNSTFLSRLSIRFVLNKHLDLVNIKRIRIHDFRHSHITNLYDMGCDGKYVAERVGHSNEMTSRKVYQHLTKNKKRKNDLLVSKMKI